jgi:hypothetical protein
MDAPFLRILRPPFGPNLDTAEDWWLTGGIPAANCIAAYQPTGAASYAASKVNLANPGTYDAYKGDTYEPTWDATNGWDFSDYVERNGLATGIYPTSGNKYTYIIKFTNGRVDNYGIAIGSRTGSNSIRIFQSMNVDDHAFYINATGYSTGARVVNGVLANASGKGYLDGSYETGSEAALSNNLCMIAIGAQNYQASGTAGFTCYNSFMGQVQAVAIYDTALTASQISALTTAMNQI